MNGSKDKSIWLQFVISLLYDLGFSHVWNNQYTFNASALLYSVKNKLKERFVSFWKMRLSSEEGMKEKYKFMLYFGRGACHLKKE